MKIVTFNVNGIRARLHQLAAVIDEHQPEVIALQETKVPDADFPQDAIEELGYRVVWFGQKTHYGVALLGKQSPQDVQIGFAGDGPETQRRFIAARFALGNGQSLRVLNGYFPQGESRDHPTKFPNKARFYRDLQVQLEQLESPDDLLVVVGDMNVAPADLDVGIGEDNARRWLHTGKCSFLPEERQWLQQLMRWGLADTFREVYPERQDLFSWFDYRSRGFERQPRRGLRIDLILATPPLLVHCIGAGIDYGIRGMARPSDHAPVWAEFNL